MLKYSVFHIDGKTYYYQLLIINYTSIHSGVLIIIYLKHTKYYDKYRTYRKISMHHINWQLA